MKKILLSITFSLVLSAVPEIVPVQEMAQGQSLTGANQKNESLYSNPAASAFASVYSVETTYFMPRSFSASILDTKTSTMAGALGYFRKEIEPGKNNQGGKLSMAQKVNDIFSVGVAGKMIWGPSLIKNEAGERPEQKLTDFDAGVLMNMDFLQLGLTFRNLLGGKVLLEQEREYAFGGTINWQQVMFFSMATQSKLNKGSPYQYGIGAEYVSPYYFALKGGYRRLLNTGESFWSMGISALCPKIDIHYAVEFPNAARYQTVHVLSAALLL